MPTWIVSISIISFFVLSFLVQKWRHKTAKVTGGVQFDKSVSFEHSFELYANPFSHCSRKVRLALEEKGIDYHYRTIDLIGIRVSVDVNNFEVNSDPFQYPKQSK